MSGTAAPRSGAARGRGTGGKVAAETLQSSLNDLNAEAAEKRRAAKPEPLKIDGDIGPKTEGAFASALADHGAETVTKRYSDDLGFGLG